MLGSTPSIWHFPRQAAVVMDLDPFNISNGAVDIDSIRFAGNVETIKLEVKKSSDDGPWQSVGSMDARNIINIPAEFRYTK